ncbi:hypothetical protein MPH_04153, partial [Macrophomina phaseolina MS6]
TNKLRFFI